MDDAVYSFCEKSKVPRGLERKPQHVRNTIRILLQPTARAWNATVPSCGSEQCPTQTADVRRLHPTQTVVMSVPEISSLASMSDAITDLVAKASTGVVAVKGAPYRNSSGICWGPISLRVPTTC